MFSACVAAVQSRPILHHCVVIFFVLRDRGLYDVLIWKKSSAYALGGVSCVESFITTGEQLQKNEAAFFSALPSISLNYHER